MDIMGIIPLTPLLRFGTIRVMKQYQEKEHAMTKPTHDEKRFFSACVPAQGSRLVARHALCGLLMLGMSHFAAATEYFVDVNRSDDSGDGLSVATAKHTIQAAVALAKKGTAKDVQYVTDDGLFVWVPFSPVDKSNAASLK